MLYTQDHTFIESLQKGDKETLESVYSSYFPTISNYVRQNSGTNVDAEDLFQETLIALMNNIKQPHFKLEASFKTYLYSIAKNLWLKKLRDRKVHFANELPTELADELPYHDIIEEREEKLRDWLGRITQHCQNVLKAVYFLKTSSETLMQQMGWKNKHTANNQKYKCLQQIIKAKDEDLSLH